MKFRDWLATLPKDEQDAIVKGGDEKVYAMVLQILLECGRPNVSYLQRKLKWRYSTAQHWVARICERVPTKQWDESEIPWFDFEEIAKRLLVKEAA